MTRLPYIFTGVGILLAIGFAYFFSVQNTAPGSLHSSLSTALADVGTATVKYVIDGDTIVLADGTHIRYIGMNAPEIAHPEYSDAKPAECYGEEAKTENEKLLNGITVWLEPDEGNFDKYGRTLRYIWAGNTMIDLELVRLGYARVLTISPNTKYAPEFKAAEAGAKVKKLGLWRACAN